MVVTFKNQGKIGPSFMYTLCIGSISPNTSSSNKC